MGVAVEGDEDRRGQPRRPPRQQQQLLPLFLRPRLLALCLPRLHRHSRLRMFPRPP